MGMVIRVWPSESRTPDDDSREVRSRYICITFGESDSQKSDFYLPNSQFSGSVGFCDTGVTFCRKNGRKIKYALDRITSGKTLSVACPGAISLRT